MAGWPFGVAGVAGHKPWAARNPRAATWKPGVSCLATDQLLGDARWEKRVRELMVLFPTGLIISPSHEAVVPEIPPANIAMLINTVKGIS